MDITEAPPPFPLNEITILLTFKLWHKNSFWIEQIGFMASKHPLLALKPEAWKAHGKSNYLDLPSPVLNFDKACD